MVYATEKIAYLFWCFIKTIPNIVVAVTAASPIHILGVGVVNEDAMESESKTVGNAPKTLPKRYSQNGSRAAPR